MTPQCTPYMCIMPLTYLTFWSLLTLTHTLT
jgi:hypothetical protein